MAQLLKKYFFRISLIIALNIFRKSTVEGPELNALTNAFFLHSMWRASASCIYCTVHRCISRQCNVPNVTIYECSTRIRLVITITVLNIQLLLDVPLYSRVHQKVGALLNMKFWYWCLWDVLKLLTGLGVMNITLEHTSTYRVPRIVFRF